MAETDRPSRSRRRPPADRPPDLGHGLLADTRRLLAEGGPFLTRYPFFGGQVVTVAVIVLIVTFSKALSANVVAMLAALAVGSVLMHTIVGAVMTSTDERLRTAVFAVAFALGALALLGPIAALLVIAVR